MRFDVHADPVDEVIAATSVVHKIPLLTRDRVLLGSKLVPLASYGQVTVSNPPCAPCKMLTPVSLCTYPSINPTQSQCPNSAHGSCVVR